MERLIRSFRNAFAGLSYCFATQRNMTIHLAAGAVVLVLAFLLHLERGELFLVMTAVFAVLIAETINTAIEKTVDLVTQERHKLAHIAKDVAAGAVLLTAFYAVLVGILVFGPRLWEALLKLSYF
ncbi:MAG TPA: diacylglycerol kinase family protein [Bacillota bacterium]|nr:diacylglycerol kinase family protein [Bacillota bacterium]HPZ41841.1 diacylglycerol kinase family protein [Bacillota bacterium]HQD52719.1 diacylglycerol kinase family protein [Bacillota bacterium]